MLRLWKKRPLLVSAFLLAVALTLFFGVRLVRYTIYWADPAHQQQPVQPWMTVGYVGRSWHLDPREIDKVAGLPPPDSFGHPASLKEIAAARGVPVAEVVAAVEAAIATLKPQP